MFTVKRSVGCLGLLSRIWTWAKCVGILNSINFLWHEHFVFCCVLAWNYNYCGVFLSLSPHSDRVHVTGRIDYNEYTNSEGVMIYQTSIIAGIQSHKQECLLYPWLIWKVLYLKNVAPGIHIYVHKISCKCPLGSRIAFALLYTWRCDMYSQTDDFRNENKTGTDENYNIVQKQTKKLLLWYSGQPVLIFVTVCFSSNSL